MWIFMIGIACSLCCITRGFQSLSWDSHNGHTDGNEPYRLLLLGKTGHGKSSLGNHLLGREAFKSSPSPNSVTKSGQKAVGEIGDTTIIIVDTPGISDTVLNRSKTVDLIVDAAGYSPEGYDGFLIVLNPNVRITPEEKHAIELLQTLFGDRFFNYVIFVFTHKHNFGQRTSSSNYSFKDYLYALDDDMKTFLNKAWRRYVFLDTMENSINERKGSNMKFLSHLEAIREANEGKRYDKSIFESVAAFKSDYDNGSHKRYRSNNQEEDENGWFEYFHKNFRRKTTELICFTLQSTRFSCS